MKMLILVIYAYTGMMNFYGEMESRIAAEQLVVNANEASIVLLQKNELHAMRNPGASTAYWGKLYEVSTSTVKEIAIPELKFVEVKK